MAGLLCLAVAGTLLWPSTRDGAGGLALTATVYSLALLLLWAAAAALPEGTAARIATWTMLPGWRLPWLAAAWTLIVSSALS